jgi:hypothetical protein
MATHTFAELEVTQKTYDEIAGKLREAGYSHAFIDGAIDMAGISLTVSPEKPCDHSWEYMSIKLPEDAASQWIRICRLCGGGIKHNVEPYTE